MEYKFMKVNINCQKHKWCRTEKFMTRALNCKIFHNLHGFGNALYQV